MTLEEAERALETDEMYIIRSGGCGDPDINYNSMTTRQIKKDDIKRILSEIGYL